jgi:hypothetical protein
LRQFDTAITQIDPQLSCSLRVPLGEMWNVVENWE